MSARQRKRRSKAARRRTKLLAAASALPAPERGELSAQFTDYGHAFQLALFLPDTRSGQDRRHAITTKLDPLCRHCEHVPGALYGVLASTFGLTPPRSRA